MIAERGTRPSRPISTWPLLFFDYTARACVHFHRFLLVLPLQAYAAASMLDCAFQESAAMEMMATAAPVITGCHEPDW